MVQNFFSFHGQFDGSLIYLVLRLHVQLIVVFIHLDGSMLLIINLSLVSYIVSW